MNTVLKIFLSMSFSGGLLVLALLLAKGFLKDKVSRQWQYYIWLVVILRLLLPFGPETNLLGKTYQAVDWTITQTAPLPQQSTLLNASGGVPAPAVGLEQNNENAISPAEDYTNVRPLQDILALLTEHVWLIWLAAALGLLIRKVTIYQSFMRYINAGMVPVSDMELLDRLSVAAKRAGMKKPVELCVNPLISSPLLIGCFHPCIVLPSADISEKDFQYIVLHELTHYKRRDILYKWLVQITVCLHWFNPLVHLMSREIIKACEFSCDEAVMVEMGSGSAQDYGKTLLDAMAAVGRYKENLGSVTLSENKQLLKERLGAIMKFKKPSKAVKMLTAVLTVCVILGAAFVGVYKMGTAVGSAHAAAHGTPPPDSPSDSNISASYSVPDEQFPKSSDKTDSALDSNISTPTSVPDEPFPKSDEYSSEAERYYEAGSLPLFEIVFSRLDEEAQDKWLDKIYMDERITFWGAAVGLLDEDCALIQRYAEKMYEADSIAYYSTLVMHMSEDMLEEWMDRALEDEKWSFQSVLFKALDRDDEFDELEEKWEKEWEEAQKAEYKAAGVTMDGKNYYYQGELVNIFLDVRANKSFYTLDLNPAGTVNVKMIRNAEDKITGVVYMTDEEAAELLGDMDDPDDKADVEIIPVDLKNVAAGETIRIGEYTLSQGDKIWYDISAETGNGMLVYFAKDGQKNVFYWAVQNLRQEDEPLKCTADFIVGPPANPGTYQLFLRAVDGALENVKGSITLALADGKNIE